MSNLKIKSRADFLELLKTNPGVIVIKFSAKWCKPCLQIKSNVESFFSQLDADQPSLCYDLDIDECSDVFAFLKAKKMVTTIPALLCYFKGNESYIPDDSISSSELIDIHAFFERIRADDAFRGVE
jgi:thiol-disulfide isomerase/thioredoxin